MYGSRSNGKQHGIVLTKPMVVNNMLDAVGYISSKKLENTKIIEPAAGDGAFALEIIKRLYSSSQEFEFDFEQALSNLTFFEIDSKKIHELKTNIKDFLNSINIFDLPNIIREEDFLLSNAPKSDIVVGNPPYVRHENIPVNLKELYKKKFGTFKHRSDLYILFFEKGLQLLNNNGSLCFICSNRWLKNQYGETLRYLISAKYSVDFIIDMEKTEAFEESVIAYPAIIKIDNSPSLSEINYSEIENINELASIISEKGLFQKKLSIFKSNWFVNKPLNGKSETHLDIIENQGFRIGIGVATGCDNFFISNDFKGKIEDELLLPILMSKDIKNDTFSWKGNYLINPFCNDGNLINLSDFPMAKKYFEENENILKRRHIAKKNPQNWYKTIDKVNPELTSKAKLILPDISGNKYIFIDEGNYYPHHNLYYITGNNIVSLKVLASILLSDFARQQLLNIGNKMNGGYPRWQSQYLKKLRIPQITSLPKNFVNELIRAYDSYDLNKINSLISPKNLEKYEIQEKQLTLFEPKVKYKTASI